jgi:preprotein translocase subunit SecA
MMVKIQSSEELNQAAEAIESRGERIANVTYTGPTETGEIEVRSDEETQRGLTPLTTEQMQRTGRNDPCPCGSGKKFKQCHGKLS